MVLIANRACHARFRSGAAELNPHAPSWHSFGQVRVAYFARRFELALDAAGRAPQWPKVRLFRVLALAQLDRETEAAAEFLGAHPDFRATEMAASLPLVCPRVRDFFFDGVRKAGLDGRGRADVHSAAAARDGVRGPERLVAS